MSSGLLPKPQMRDLLGRYMRRNFLLGGAFISGLFLYIEFAFIQGKQKKYRDFYKTFDYVKDFEDKKKAGVFQSVGPNDK